MNKICVQIIIILFVIIGYKANAYEVKGKISQSLNKQYKVSLYIMREVPDFDVLTPDNLIGTSLSDSTGNFKINLPTSPKPEFIYRLSIRLIQNESDKKGDLIINGFNPDKIIERNHIFLQLPINNDPFISIVNDRDIIMDYSISPVESKLKYLFGICKNHDEKIDSVMQQINATSEGASTSNVHYQNRTQLQIHDIKNWLEDNINTFIKSTDDGTSAVFAGYLMFKINKGNLPHAESIYEFFHKKFPRNIYLSSFIRYIEKDQLDARLTYIKLWLKIAAFVIVALILYVLWLVKKIAKIKTLLITQTSPSKDPLNTLSQKEIEIVSLLGEGLSNKEIAAKLYVEVSTIKKHVSNIYLKTGVKGRRAVSALLNKNQV